MNVPAHDTFPLLGQRRQSARDRLDEVRSKLAELPGLEDATNLCIYVTGSFGRLEASEHSDLDLFFIETSQQPSQDIGRLQKTLLDADIIRLVEDLDFPPFSRDGEFLVVHQLREILKHLGGPEDDSKNYFTARLLLLLEGRDLFGSTTYRHVVGELVDAYYRDYQDHETDFRPVFLANDIVRFRKTLCLNYEHRRNRRSENEAVRLKSHVKNFKLKFSRLLTCYSALAWIAAQKPGSNAASIVEMVSLTPTERILSLVEHSAEARQHIVRAMELYTWFLEQVGRDEDAVLDWMADPEIRNTAFGRGRDFGTEIFQLLQHLSEGQPFLRYLVV